MDYSVLPVAWAAGSDFAELDGASGGVALLPLGANSALDSFTGNDATGGFDFANYFDFGALASADAPVIITKNSGAVNEYVRYFSSNPIANNVIAIEKVPGATSTLPTATVDMIFQFTAIDFLGHKHLIQVPFVLAQ